MSKENNLHDFLVDIADAIRKKKGTSDPINAQRLSEEIKSIETSSPFAVDFGEEIASGNPAYMGALQWDIDYYNEVVRSIKSGEKTIKDYTSVPLRYEYEMRIAWIPVVDGVAVSRTIFDSYYNLRSFTDESKGFPVNSINAFYQCNMLEVVRINTSNVNTFTRFFAYCYNLKDCGYIDLTNETEDSAKNMLQQSTKLRVAYLKGVKNNQSFNSARYFELDCVKYLLDHCQARGDGASYTLTLHADARNRFMAKCTEGHEEYDAEYAASLASANSKGLTLA